MLFRSALAALAASATSLEHLSGSCLDKASRDKAKSLKESVALSQSVVQLTLRSFEAQTAQSMEGEGKCDQAFSSVSAGMQQRITVARSTLQKTIRTNLGLLKSYREDLSGSNLRFVSQGQDQGACIVKGLAQLGVTRQAYAESLSALDLVADDLAETIGRMEVYRSELAVLQSRCRSEHTDGAAPTSASALSRHGDGGKKFPKGRM